MRFGPDYQIEEAAPGTVQAVDDFIEDFLALEAARARLLGLPPAQAVAALALAELRKHEALTERRAAGEDWGQARRQRTDVVTSATLVIGDIVRDALQEDLAETAQDDGTEEQSPGRGADIFFSRLLKLAEPQDDQHPAEQ